MLFEKNWRCRGLKSKIFLDTFCKSHRIFLEERLNEKFTAHDQRVERECYTTLALQRSTRDCAWLTGLERLELDCLEVWSWTGSPVARCVARAKMPIGFHLISLRVTLHLADVARSIFGKRVSYSLATVSDRNSFRANQNYSDICIRANASQSEPIRKTFWISFVENAWKLIRLNPRFLSAWIQVNFQSEWIRINLDMDLFLIRMNQCSDWFAFKRIENLLRIHSDRSLGFSRINFQVFFDKRDSKLFSDWLWLIRIGLDTDIGMILNISDSIRDFNSHKSVSIRILIHSYWKSIRVRIDSESIGLKIYFGFIRIEVSDWIELVLIGSEWIPIRNFHQGYYCLFFFSLF